MGRRAQVACVVGTRPDAIKTAPVVLELRRQGSVDCLLVATGQHREMLAQALSAFDLTPDVDLDIMAAGQTLADVTIRSLQGLDSLWEKVRPSMVLAQGDTTTTFAAGLSAFYRQVPFGHIEAGLRTETIWNPFPEEFNRRAVSLFAAHHYAPTSLAVANLKREGISESAIFVTGNTGIDAVRYVSGRAEQHWFPAHTGPVILLTTHRRENWGEPQTRIAMACRDVLDGEPEALLVVAMHRNPEVRATLLSVLGGHPRVQAIEPPEYADFVKLMERSTIILSDSGGVQEEAPAFGKPVLVLRETTERPEGVEAGVARLVGTDRKSIADAALTLLRDASAYASMARATSPYGDGRASERIAGHVCRALGLGHDQQPT